MSLVVKCSFVLKVDIVLYTLLCRQSKTFRMSCEVSAVWLALYVQFTSRYCCIMHCMLSCKVTLSFTLLLRLFVLSTSHMAVDSIKYNRWAEQTTKWQRKSVFYLLIIILTIYLKIALCNRLFQQIMFYQQASVCFS